MSLQVGIRTLGIWEEAVGVLKGVDCDEGFLVFDDFTAYIPSHLLKQIKGLESHIDDRIRLLRTDLAEKPLILLVDEPSQ